LRPTDYEFVENVSCFAGLVCKVKGSKQVGMTASWTYQTCVDNFSRAPCSTALPIAKAQHI